MSKRTVSPVIAAVDGSDASLAALDAAASHAASRGRPLEIMHSHTSAALYGAVLGEPYPPEYSDPPVHVVQILTRAEQRARDAHPDLAVETHLIHTAPAAWLVERSRDAALIVVGSRGAGGFTGLLLGSVSSQVATHALCPVMVVRGDSARPSTAPVVAGVDGSEHSQAALDFAFEEASRRQAPLVAVYAWKTAPRDLPMPGRLSVFGFDQAQEISERILAEALAGYGEKYPDVKVTPVLSFDFDPAMLLTDESTEAALVVVGSRGRGEVASLLLGSVGYTLIHHAACPVVIARTAGR
ncbi:universal stress protein [Longispora albida]|uniref:universal stress protein n=1 Tax=Longispora albida TaxID=203523 RepID=UPI000367FA2E|nr:universal stress protein [Longispora albida]